MPNYGTTASNNFIAPRVHARRPSQSQTMLQLGYVPAFNAHVVLVQLSAAEAEA
jgi:hypothetical protein